LVKDRKWLLSPQGALADKHLKVFCDIYHVRGIPVCAGEAGERWLELCQQAAVEQDASKLLKLISEINQLLEAKEERLHARKQGA
jgi:hypothetical protein